MEGQKFEQEIRQRVTRLIADSARRHEGIFIFLYSERVFPLFTIKLIR